ncbi:uncharacterized protein LOC132624196 [Lycium barbarum]|uniref:uncharacterized protein LOC132624196 n=1 Tax=Lycium barbarum TaxID=112863 RepID=UPI00293EEE1D|nr:uncharacterized protein LOC132624196 [Lycium barbarum]
MRYLRRPLGPQFMVEARPGAMALVEAGEQQHQPGDSQARAPDYGGYSASFVSVQHPTLDRGCFECGEMGHFKRNCPRLRQGGQGGTQPNRGGFQSSRDGHLLGRGELQTGQVDRNGSQATGG